MSERALRLSRLAVVVISVAAMGVVLVQGWREGAELPDDFAVRVILAVPFSFFGLFMAAFSWRALVGSKWRVGVATFGSSLPVRHLPLGGLGQIAGLAGLSLAEGADRRRAMEAAPLFLVATAVGASLVALPLVAMPGVATWIRWLLGVAGLGGLVVLVAGESSLRWIERRLRRFQFTAVEGLRPAIGYSALAAIGAGAAFAVLFPPAGSLPEAISGFAAAWLAGFLFFPAPAGLGAREAVMVAIWPNVDSAEIVAVALSHRLSTLVGEFLLFGLGLLLTRRSRVSKEGA